MKRQCLIPLAIVAVALFGLSSLALAQSGVVAQPPGNTVVLDAEGDFLFRNCDPSSPNEPCSLPPLAPLALPGWFDIKKAKITEIGKGRVDLLIELYEPIPEKPPVPFVTYYWQFQDGCVVPSPTDKDGIRIAWDGDTETWSAIWYVITSCTPRTVSFGDPVPFQFTEDGVKVRVLLTDLLTKGGSPLLWFAGVRRLPFKHQTFTHTIPVDVAPNVEAFNPNPPPILFLYPEDSTEPSAIWEPR
jgi:hypothetical protein